MWMLWPRPCGPSTPCSCKAKEPTKFRSLNARFRQGRRQRGESLSILFSKRNKIFLCPLCKLNHASMLAYRARRWVCLRAARMESQRISPDRHPDGWSTSGCRKKEKLRKPRAASGSKAGRSGQFPECWPAYRRHRAKITVRSWSHYGSIGLWTTIRHPHRTAFNCSFTAMKARSNCCLNSRAGSGSTSPEFL